MRRKLAISLLLFFILPLVSSLFGATDAEASLPYCCRRGGAHHCAMSSGSKDQDTGALAVREKCPYTHDAIALLSPPSLTPSIAAAIFAGVASHPASASQAEAQFRISFDRSRQKRGPPALLV